MRHKNHQKPAAGVKPYFKAAVKPDGALEILMYEEIGEDWYDGGVTAKTVKQKIDDAGVFSTIQLRINSPGGDAFEGVAIANVIRAQQKPVEVYVDGIAASAASIVAMCGDTIVMGRGAMMMIHKAWTGCVGNANDMRKMADTLDKIDTGAIAAGYTAQTGKSVEEITALMEAEAWMDAEECVREGFATSIVDDGDEQKKALAMAKTFRSLAKLKNIPEKLKSTRNDGMDDDDAPPCECECQACMDGNCSSCTHEGCDCANCVDCPMKSDTSASAEKPETPAAAEPQDSNLSLYEARLAQLRRRA
jgi:ATP-dependent protease ClpP protease subunit